MSQCLVGILTVKTKLNKIFPNKYDVKNFISGLVKIPTKSALKKNYSIRVQFPKKTERFVCRRASYNCSFENPQITRYLSV